MLRDDVRMGTLHLVLGPWGSGKTTLARELPALAANCVVFDWDLIIPGLSRASGKDVRSDSSTWDGLRATWSSIIEAVLGSGHDVVLCGPAGAAEMAIGAIRGITVRCAYLDCPDEVLSSRLQARGAKRHEIAEELAVARTLRASDYQAVRTESRDSGEVAADVAAWIGDPGHRQRC